MRAGRPARRVRQERQDRSRHWTDFPESLGAWAFFVETCEEALLCYHFHHRPVAAVALTTRRPLARGMGVVEITEPHRLGVPRDLDRASWAISLLRDNYVSDAHLVWIRNRPVRIRLVVVLLAVEHHHDVGVLFD